MAQIHVNENIRVFLNALPSNIMSLILYDKSNQIVGFVISDGNTKIKQAKIYNLNCKKIKEVSFNTTIKEMVNFLIRDKCTYIK